MHSEQNGESSVHYAADIDCKLVHYANEDRDVMRLLVQTGGDVTLGTSEVNFKVKVAERIR